MDGTSLPCGISRGGRLNQSTKIMFGTGNKRQNEATECLSYPPKAAFVPVSIEISQEDQILVSATLDPLQFGIQDSDVIIVKEECHELDFEEREALLESVEPENDSNVQQEIIISTSESSQTLGDLSESHQVLGTSISSSQNAADKNREKEYIRNVDRDKSALNEQDSISTRPASTECDEDEILKIFNTQPPLQDAAPKRNRKPTQKTAEYLCRICGQHSYKLVKIFGTQGKQQQISEKINLHLPIKVNEKDLLPLGICLVCLAALKTCDDLYKNSSSTDTRLRQILLKEDSTTTKSSAHQRKRTAAQLPLDASPPSHPADERNDVAVTEIIDGVQQTSSTDTQESPESRDKTSSNTSTVLNFNNNEAVGDDAEDTEQSAAESSDEGDNDLMEDNSEEPSSDSEGDQEEEDKEEEEEEDDTSDAVPRVRKPTQSKTVQKCDLCDGVYLGTQELAKHRKTHSPEERLTCKDCGKMMPNDNSYQSHRKTHTDNIHPCGLCGKILSSKSGLSVHQLIHAIPKFCCDLCGKTTRTVGKLRSHMAVHSDERPFCCSICGQRFKTKHVHDQHAITHNEKKMFICDICGHGCHRPSHLSKHMRTHNNQQNGTVYTSRRIRIQVPRHPTATYLVRIRKWKCRKCMAHYESRDSLVRHLETDHSDLIPKEDLLCRNCGKQCSDIQTHKNHERQCGMLLGCEFCGRFFATKIALKVHVRDHTGERPYICRYCGKSFKSILMLNHHERDHTGERPYKCDLCDKAFRSQPNLYQHKLCHGAPKKYKCGLCNYETPRSGALRIHQRTHTGEKPFSCNICGKAFRAVYDMKNHVKMHSRPEGLRRQRRAKSCVRKAVVSDETGGSNDSTLIEVEVNSLPILD